MATSPWDMDARAVRMAFARASKGFESAAFVHGEARHRLLERLDWVKLTPRLVVDAGCGLGQGAAALATRYPEARVLALDSALAMLAGASRRLPAGTAPHCLAAEADQLPLPTAGVDLLFANLLVPWIVDVTRLFEEWRRVLTPDGLVVFTTLGPDTLHELAQAWARVDDGPHVHGFFDMHDVGDALLASGLREPVLDVEHLRITYPTVEALAKELKACGAQNATLGRRRTLTGPGRWRAMVNGYPRGAAPNPITATVELVYGQAWGGVERSATPAGPTVTAVPVTAIKRRN